MNQVLNSSLLILAETAQPEIMWFYAGFIALVLVFLALDLGVFHRNAHVVSVKEAATWSAIWTACALAFTVLVYFGYQSHWLGLGLSVPVVGTPGETMTLDGATAAEQYLTGYIIEWSLSVDNLFVIAVVFSYFAVPPKYQHRVLFWGILGALVMRGVMIALGAVLIARFGWIVVVKAQVEKRDQRIQPVRGHSATEQVFVAGRGEAGRRERHKLVQITHWPAPAQVSHGQSCIHVAGSFVRS